MNDVQHQAADDRPDALILAQGGGLLPACTAEQMAAALEAYRELQRVLDTQMPDQLMMIVDKPFRKKGYWRAVSLAFRLSVEAVEERREVSGAFDDGRPNFGYLVTCRARSPDGREAVGDGSCFAVEKAPRFRCPHPEPGNPRRTIHYPHYLCPDFRTDYQWRAFPSDATDHNVRSHAFTRAQNRAIANLVAFGEVSAEEMEGEEGPENGNEAGQDAAPAGGQRRAAAPRGSYARPQSKSAGQQQGQQGQRAQGPAGGARTITEPQQKRLFAIAMDTGWSADTLRGWLAAQGYQSSAEIPAHQYDRLVEQVQAGTGA